MVINFKNQVLSKSIKDNIVQIVLYRLAFIVAHLFKFLKITPNQITFVSFLLCIISCYFLNNNKVDLFLIFWYVSHFLDYCDGTLARLTGRTTKTLLRLDHFIDLIRITITFLFISLFYKSDIVWVLSIVFLSSFFLSQILSLEYSAKKNDHLKFSDHININKSNMYFKHFYNVFFTFNGHSLFTIGLVLLNEKCAIIFFSYFIFLNLKNSYGPMNYLLKNNRDN